MGCGASFDQAELNTGGQQTPPKHVMPVDMRRKIYSFACTRCTRRWRSALIITPCPGCNHWLIREGDPLLAELEALFDEIGAKIAPRVEEVD